MNKYLLSFFIVLFSMNAYADMFVSTFGTKQVVNVIDVDGISLNTIKTAYQDELVIDEYVISNSSVIIDNFSDWQDWNTKVSLDPIVSLYINNLDNTISNEKVRHLTATNKQNVIIYDANHLYRTRLDNGDNGVFLSLVRETNYEKVFNDSRGKFLENIRLNNPNDKMLKAMDTANNMADINSIMNASYHFNPIILMNPVKIINRSSMLSFLSNDQDFNSGANFDFIVSDKINNYGGHIYFSDRYNDLFVKLGINLNKFSYQNNLNEFDGFAYGIDLRAKQYVDKLWFNGVVGVNRTNFDVSDIYLNNKKNPKGTSEYARLDIGHDFTYFHDWLVSPFAGLMFQNVEILGNKDTDINLHAGTTVKYSFITDGIKYEYGVGGSVDNEANLHIGINIGFLSVVDNAGADIGIVAFQDDFGTSYRFTLKAKIKF